MTNTYYYNDSSRDGADEFVPRRDKRERRYDRRVARELLRSNRWTEEFADYVS